MRIPPTQQSNALGSLDHSMIPAINIVFLLLIFFMIAGQIEAQSDLLKLPEANVEKAVEESRLIVELHGDGKVLINGEAIDSDLVSALKARSISSETGILCRVHQGLPASALDPLLSALRQLGVSKINIATKLSS